MNELGVDRSLTKVDIMELMGFNACEADSFMKRFGHQQGYRARRTIGQRELMFLQLDGVLADWVKKNCREGRRTVVDRREDNK